MICVDAALYVDIEFCLLAVGFCGLSFSCWVLTTSSFIDYLPSLSCNVAYILQVVETSRCEQFHILLLNNHIQLFNCKQYANIEPKKNWIAHRAMCNNFEYYAINFFIHSI